MIRSSCLSASCPRVYHPPATLHFEIVHLATGGYLFPLLLVVDLPAWHAIDRSSWNGCAPRKSRPGVTAYGPASPTSS